MQISGGEASKVPTSELEELLQDADAAMAYAGHAFDAMQLYAKV